MHDHGRFPRSSYSAISSCDLNEKGGPRRRYCRDHLAFMATRAVQLSLAAYTWYTSRAHQDQRHPQSWQLYYHLLRPNLLCACVLSLPARLAVSLPLLFFSCLLPLALQH